MMPAILNRAFAKIPSALCVSVLLLLAGSAAQADQWILAVEPSFMDHKMRRPIEGSQRTTLAIARVVDGEIEPLTREQKKSVHMTYDQIRAEALKTASSTLARMKPEFLRDKNGVIRHAAIVLVFSKQDDTHLRLAETIIGNYLSSNQPVSREIFAWESGRLRSLGVLQ